MRRFRWLWPSIATPSDAENAAKIAAGAALVLAVLNGVLVVAAVVSVNAQSGVDGLGMFFEAGLWAMVAWRVRGYSLPWAIAGLTLYLAEVLWGLITFSPGVLGIVTICVVLAFIGGVRGTYFLSRFEQAQPSDSTTNDPAVP